MCYDADTSLLAWTLAYSIAYFLFNRNKNYDRWNASFIICFTTVQLIEAGIWTSKDNSDLNDLLTRLLLLALLAQPLTQSYMGAVYTNEAMLWAMTCVFVGVFIWGLWRTSRGKFQSVTGIGGHLNWRDESRNYFLGPPLITYAYLAGLFIPLLFMKECRGIPLIIVGLGTAIYSTFLTSPQEFGSMWCFTSVIYAMFALFV